MTPFHCRSSSMDHLSGILAFVHAAEARSFTRAAHRLGISPSGISKAISRLDSRHGVRLLQRTARSITLIPRVRATTRSKKILADLEEAADVLTDSHKSPRGLLRITLPLSIGDYTSRASSPSSRVGIRRFSSRYAFPIVGLILSKKGSMWPSASASSFSDSRLVARRLATGTLTTCATPSYLKRYGVPKRPEGSTAA